MHISFEITDTEKGSALHQAKELAEFCGGFLATNEGRACITPIMQELFTQLMDQLPESENKRIDHDIKEALTKIDAVKRLATRLGLPVHDENCELIEPQ